MMQNELLVFKITSLITGERTLVMELLHFLEKCVETDWFLNILPDLHEVTNLPLTLSLKAL